MSILDLLTPKPDVKCDLCHNYLSVFPIRLCSNQQTICDRCDVPPGLSAIRNEAAEAVLSAMAFPCCYEDVGCKRRVSAAEMREHERLCTSRTVGCVVAHPPCGWKGRLDALHQHCAEDHAEVIADGGKFVIDSKDMYESDGLLKVDNSVYFFSWTYDREDRVMSWAVYSHQHPTEAVKPRSCTVTMKAADTTISKRSFTSSHAARVFTTIHLDTFAKENVDFVAEGRFVVGGCAAAEVGVQGNFPPSYDLRCGWCHEIALPPLFRCPQDMYVICCFCHLLDRSCPCCDSCGRRPAKWDAVEAVLEQRGEYTFSGGLLRTYKAPILRLGLK